MKDRLEQPQPRFYVYTRVVEKYWGDSTEPSSTVYRWGVYDVKAQRWTQVYKVPLIGRWLAVRLARRLNRGGEML